MWKIIKEQTLNSIPGGSSVLVSIQDTDDHVDFLIKNNGVWKYAYCGREVQDMKKYTHFFIPKPVSTVTLKVGSLVCLKSNTSVLMEVISVNGATVQIKYVQKKHEALERKNWKLNEVIEMRHNLKISEFKDTNGLAYDIEFEKGKFVTCLEFWFSSVIDDIMNDREINETKLI